MSCAQSELKKKKRKLADDHVCIYRSVWVGRGWWHLDVLSQTRKELNQKQLEATEWSCEGGRRTSGGGGGGGTFQSANPQEDKPPRDQTGDKGYKAAV